MTTTNGTTGYFDGARLREFRTRSGESQGALATAISMSAITVSQWETGLRVPRSAGLERLAQHFQVPPSAFLSDTPPPRPPLPPGGTKAARRPSGHEYAGAVEDPEGRRGACTCGWQSKPTEDPRASWQGHCGGMALRERGPAPQSVRGEYVRRNAFLELVQRFFPAGIPTADQAELDRALRFVDELEERA